MVEAGAAGIQGLTKSPTSAKPERHDSVEVVARLSPEEGEERKLNDAY